MSSGLPSPSVAVRGIDHSWEKSGDVGRRRRGSRLFFPPRRRRNCGNAVAAKRELCAVTRESRRPPIRTQS